MVSNHLIYRLKYVDFKSSRQVRDPRGQAMADDALTRAIQESLASKEARQEREQAEAVQEEQQLRQAIVQSIASEKERESRLQASRCGFRDALKLKSVYLRTTRPDGNCIYSCAAEFLFADSSRHVETRRAALEHLPEFDAQLIREGLVPSSCTRELYVAKHKKEGVDGDRTAMLGLMRAYGLSIRVRHEGGTSELVDPNNSMGIDDGRPLELAYVGGFHYDVILSVAPACGPTELAVFLPVHIKMLGTPQCERIASYLGHDVFAAVFAAHADFDALLGRAATAAHPRASQFANDAARNLGVSFVRSFGTNLPATWSSATEALPRVRARALSIAHSLWGLEADGLAESWIQPNLEAACAIAAGLEGVTFPPSVWSTLGPERVLAQCRILSRIDSRCAAPNSHDLVETLAAGIVEVARRCGPWTGLARAGAVRRFESFAFALVDSALCDEAALVFAAGADGAMVAATVALDVAAGAFGPTPSSCVASMRALAFKVGQCGATPHALALRQALLRRWENELAPAYVEHNRLAVNSPLLYSAGSLVVEPSPPRQDVRSLEQQPSAGSLVMEHSPPRQDVRSLEQQPSAGSLVVEPSPPRQDDRSLEQQPSAGSLVVEHSPPRARSPPKQNVHSLEQQPSADSLVVKPSPPKQDIHSLKQQPSAGSLVVEHSPPRARSPPRQPRARPLLPHQRRPAELLREGVSRILVVHPTGSGKSRTMLHTLDQLFDDRRAKIPFFPSPLVCANFYLQLLRWPSRYRDFVTAVSRELASVAPQFEEWIAAPLSEWNVDALPAQASQRAWRIARDVLELKGVIRDGVVIESTLRVMKETHPTANFPRAPLRAYAYGGRLDCDRAPIFKFGASPNSVFSNKVVMMDEVHNLLKRGSSALEYFKRALSTADGAVVVGLTATPVVTAAKDADDLVEIVRGSGPFALATVSRESCDNFPATMPEGAADGYCLREPEFLHDMVVNVTLQGPALVAYQRKSRDRLSQKGRAFSQKRMRRYCDVPVGRVTAKARQAILANPTEFVPKLHAVCNEVSKEATKCVIFADRCAVDLLVSLARRAADGSYAVGCSHDVAEFNSSGNVEGQVMRAIVLNRDFCSEGLSFFGVRRVLLASIPRSVAEFVQQVGRAVRMGSHDALPPEERVVRVLMFAAKVPSVSSADDVGLNKLKRDASRLLPAVERLYGSDGIIDGMIDGITPP